MSLVWTLAANGTQTAVIGTEHSLSTLTTNATFMYEVDLTNMVAGDVVELRVKGITLASGATGQMYEDTRFGPQINPRVQTWGIPSNISISFTLKQTVGTGRAFPWKVLSSP